MIKKSAVTIGVFYKVHERFLIVSICSINICFMFEGNIEKNYKLK
jgi:hypothetical protein